MDFNRWVVRYRYLICLKFFMNCASCQLVFESRCCRNRMPGRSHQIETEEEVESILYGILRPATNLNARSS